MPFNKDQLIGIYRRRARNYDLSANLYYLIGFRETTYRRKAVAALNLQPGDTVVEIGCGTGLNFPFLQQAVGPKGKIIGVDLTDAMLTEARRRVERQGWDNVELVQSDAAAYQFPHDINGVISTFAITLVTEYDQVISAGAKALVSGGCMVIVDLKEPENWPRWLVKLGIWITRPFGVTLDLTSRHPWESMQKYLTQVSFENIYFGFAFTATGRK